MRCAQIACGVMLAAMGADGRAQTAAVAIDAPREISFFDPPAIRVSGLPPLQPVSISVTAGDPQLKAPAMTARYFADLSGAVDTRRSVANGDYEGIDAMGLFRGPRGAGQQMPLSGSLHTTITVADEKGETLATAVIERLILPRTVTITEVGTGEGFVGRFYQHAGARPRPAIVMLTGSGGGIDIRGAPWLASQGYNVLSLGYFNGAGLPNDLLELPLEYFAGAIQWLTKKPSVRDVSVMGASKGAEAALLIGSYFPDRVRLVVALLPTHVVWEGIDARARFGGDPKFASPGKSSWSLGGKGLPFVPKYVSAARLNKPPAQGTVDQYAPMLDKPIDSAAMIPVERIRGPVFLVGAGDDLAWPSVRMAREVKSRLSKRQGRAEVQLWEYPLAGHALGPPGIGTNLGLGGTLSGNALASQDAFARLRAFLRAHLGDVEAP